MTFKFRQRSRLSMFLLVASMSIGATMPVAAYNSEEPLLVLMAETALRSVTPGSVDNDTHVAQPAQAAQAASTAPEGWDAVQPHMLDDMRGGFATSLNLTLSFGIERAVYLNGALVATTSFNLPSINALTHDDPGAVRPAASSVALLQNGPGNVFSANAASTPATALVIQNTLNNQAIQSMTTINASANSLQLLRQNDFQGLLRDSITQGLVPR